MADRTDPYFPDPEDLDGLLRASARKLRKDIRTHEPATVKSYDPETRRVTCTVDALPVIRMLDPSRRPENALEVDGDIAVLKPIELRDIRVVWPRTKAGFLTFPLVAGDTGILHISSRSLARWYAEGKPVDPVLGVTHQLADAVFTPGVQPDTDPWGPTDQEATVLHGEIIKLGEDAEQGAALGQTLAEFLSDLKTWLDSHTHGYTDVGTPLITTPPVSAPPPGMPDPSPSVPDVESDTVLIEE